MSRHVDGRLGLQINYNVHVVVINVISMRFLSKRALPLLCMMRGDG